jgi:hypothetical protein
MGLNIENIVNVINEFGITNADNNKFVSEDDINSEFQNIIKQSESFIEIIKNLIEIQVKIIVDESFFILIQEELNKIGAVFYVRYHTIRCSKKGRSFDLKTTAILRELEIKSSSINELISHLEVQKRYVNYLGSTESEELGNFGIMDSEKEKDWSLRHRYYLLEYLGILNSLSVRFKNYQDRHLIVSKIMNIHHENVKKLHLDKYKNIKISPEEKKEVESYVMKFK